MITVHNLDASQILKLNIESDDFIHVKSITKEQLLDTENLELFSLKTLSYDNEFKIINFNKCSLIDAINLKYKEFFPNINITCILSTYEDDAFSQRRIGEKFLEVEDTSVLKLSFNHNTIYLNVLAQKLSYSDKSLNLKNFISDDGHIFKNALQVTTLNNRFNYNSVQWVDYKQQEELIKNKFDNIE